METKPKSFFQRYWVIGITLIVAVACAYYVYRIYDYWCAYPDQAGQFGDMFGAITAVVGSLTFGFLIYSINLQREALAIARDDYQLALQEMKLQNTIGQSQLETNRKSQRSARRQRIDNTFFNMISLYNHIKENLLVHEEYTSDFGARKLKDHKDANAFVYILNETDEKFKQGGSPKSYTLDNKQWFITQYNISSTALAKETEVPHYYNSVMNIIEFVRTSKLSDEAQSFYCITLNSLITPFERANLYYYVALKRGLDPMLADYVVKMGFFKSVMDQGVLSHPTYHAFIYPELFHIGLVD